MTDRALTPPRSPQFDPGSDPIALVASLPGRLWVANIAGVVDVATPGWWSFVGKRPDSTTWFEGIHPAELAACREAFSAACAGAMARITYRRRDCDDQYRWVEDEFQPLPGPGGINRVIGSLTDLTPARIAEARAEDLAGELAQRESQVVALLRAAAAVREDVSLVEVVQNALADHEGADGRPVHSSHEDALPSVPAVQAATEQAFKSLLRFSQQHSPPGATIRVHVLRLPDGIGVRVHDEGEALSSAELDALSGSGGDLDSRLDLAVCKCLIEVQDGKFWANPRQGGGRELGFSLPLGRDS